MAIAEGPKPSVASHSNWSQNTKLLATLVFLVLIGLSFWKFRHLLQPLVVSAVVAYLFHPVVTRLARLPFLSRALASVLVFAAFFILFFYTFISLGTAAFTQLEQLLQGVPQMVARVQEVLGTQAEQSPFLQALFDRPELRGLFSLLNLGSAATVPNFWNIEAIVDQALVSMNPVLRQSGNMASNLARGTFNALATTILVVILSLYMIIDIPRVEGYIGSMAPIRSVQNEMRVLWRRFSQIWGAYLRGQINISIFMFILVSVLLSLLGVKNAFGLGLLAGAMEFLPLIGPVISVAVALLATFLQGSTIFELSTMNYTLLVGTVLLLVNLLESNLLVPRILGRELRLHPLVVLMSVLMGTSLAGILGAILAAPVAATVKLLGAYTWYRILDEPPLFLYAEVSAAEQSRPAHWQDLKQLLRRRVKSARRRKKTRDEHPKTDQNGKKPDPTPE